MKKFLKSIFNWFRDSKFADWLLNVFKNQLGNITKIIYKDAIEAVNKTKILSEFVMSQPIDFIDLQKEVKSQFNVNLLFLQIKEIKDGNMRVRFDIAKQILITELEISKKEYKMYIVDTVIQLAYSYLKEKGE
jgi:hypothetical protein